MFPTPFPIIAIVGPTAVGKTALSLRLARELSAEIVNVDSVQIYRYLDIGSAKPSLQERKMVPHHLVDIFNPDEPMDAAAFSRMVRLRTARLISQGRAVILSGGTGLYMRSVLHGISEIPGRYPGLRESFRKFAADYGTERLHEILSRVDPDSAVAIASRDLFRIMRALEIFYATGMTRTEWFRKARPLSLSRLTGCPVLKIGLMLSRKTLYQRIERRVDQMMEQGFVQEVQTLLDAGYNPELKPLQSIGYRHIIAYLTGAKSFEEAVREMKRDTRRFAKRQLTWFRADPEIRWFNSKRLAESHSIWQVVNRA